jgi:hypothetical protein
MTTTPKTGGPAFPRAEGETSFPEDGMTLRDWFAGQALAVVAESVIAGMAENGPHDPSEDIAWACYQIADAMIAERDTDNDYHHHPRPAQHHPA